MKRLLEKLPPLPTRSSIDEAAKQLQMKHYHIRDDLKVDVDGNVDLTNKNLTQLPFKFHIVSGDFIASENKLSTFHRFPFWVGGDMVVRHNQFQTFEGYHTECKGSIDISFNKLKSLRGMPREVLGSFECQHNLLENLEGLAGAIWGFLDCSHNRLKNLKGAEKTAIEEFLAISGNKHFKSIEGLPYLRNPEATNVLFFYDQAIVEIAALEEKAKRTHKEVLSFNIINSTQVFRYLTHRGKYTLPFHEVQAINEVYEEQKKLKTMTSSHTAKPTKSLYKI